MRVLDDKWIEISITERKNNWRLQLEYANLRCKYSFLDLFEGENIGKNAC